MPDTHVVALLEAELVIATVGPLNEVRVTKLIPIVDVGRTMIFKILAGTLNAITEAALLRFSKLRWGGIPSAGPLGLTVSVLWGRGWAAVVLATIVLRKRACTCCKDKCECCCCETIAGHSALSEDISGW